MAEIKCISPGRANQLASDFNLRQMESVFDAIEKSAERGNYSVTYNTKNSQNILLKETIIKELKALNFSTCPSSHGSEFIVISWG